MTGPDPTPELRAAHRARQSAAAPDAPATPETADRRANGTHPADPGRAAGTPADSGAAGGAEPGHVGGGAGGVGRSERAGGEPGRVESAGRAGSDLGRVESAGRVEIGIPVDGRRVDDIGEREFTVSEPADPLFVGPVPEKPPLPVGLDGGPVDLPPAQRKGRAGRNLPAAIGVGAVLGGVVLLSLLLYKPAFYVVILVAIGVGTWEMVRAVGTAGIRPPMVPLLVGGAVMAGVTWYWGADALPYGLLGTAVAVMGWRLAGGPTGYQRDVVTGLLIASYVPFLGGFVVLLLAPDDGHLRVLAMIAAVVMSDTGGYAFGVFLGRHKLAPTVSPSKSWEGFGGSMITAAVGGALLVHFMFDGQWYWGLVFGACVAAASTLGDLAESLLKRDLGVKDMSTLLPGHGGLMDRLDSILLAAPVAYAVLTNLVPPG